ncbi:MAG TPA: efflux RND transporter periplasmic adaptor subunit [Steroidobacteraceae bacterium]|nr:efflux RND transporter periplasmic adaptor subunit [Steroidobacteraceae bacterium]
MRPKTDAEAPRGMRRFLWIMAVLAVILAIWGVVSRVRARNELTRQTAVASVPVVTTQKPSRSPAIEELVLPGDVQAFIEAPIYARTSGYLKKWYVDIGAQVKQGQLLAEIDTPEVDQELRQSHSQLATAQANALLAESTDVRWKGLLSTRSVSQQDADTKAADAAASRATAASAQANVARLQELESFKRVVAPFDGVVTLRNTDIGALINAGESAGQALFRVADTHRLRIYVQVPEPYATRTQPGVEADLRFTEHPGRNYAATLVRTARALDPVLRTLQVEFQVDNPSGELFPGAYAEVHIKIPGSARTLRVPASALMFRAAGLQLAVVGANGRVSLRHIVEGRDFGRSVEVLSGLSVDDEIIDNPPDSLVDGAEVHVAQQTPPAAATAGGVAGQS